MNEKLTRIYNLEKEYIGAKQQLQKFITEELTLMQKQRNYELSVEALNASQNRVLIPFGKAFILRYL